MGFTALAAAALLALPAAAQALPEDRTYEMVSPPDKNDGDVGAGGFPAPLYAGINGDRLAYMALGAFADAPTNSLTGVYLARRGDDFWTSRSGLLPVLPFSTLGGALTYSVSPDASRVISVTNRNVETGQPFANGENGAAYLLDGDTGEAELVVPDLDVQDNPVSALFPVYAGNADYSRLFVAVGAPLTEDAVGISGNKVYMFEDGELTLASRLPDETPSGGSLSNAGPGGLVPHQSSLDGNVLYFQSGGLYRRDFSGATPETVLVSADENPNEDPPVTNGAFSGASADGSIAYFTSSQPLVEEDTDTTTDLYQYDHTKPAGSRLTLISVDDNPGDDPSSVGRVHTVSADGSTVVFSATSQLVDGEPTDPGNKLYVARDGVVDYVANTGVGFAGELSAQAVALAEDGSQMALLTDVALTADDNGGFAQVYVRDNVTGDVVCASCRDGEPNTAAAEFRMGGGVQWFGETESGSVRNLSSEGHVFFHTAEALLPQDTNGKIDVYVWQDGELDLISSGRSDDHSRFASATPDGKDVFFVTRERLSGWDFDDHLDVYTARIDGGLPEPTPPGVPCTGSDCQGPPPLPPMFPDPGTGDADGPGNADPAPVDCTSDERKANRLANKAKRLNKKAKRLAKQARKASGNKAKRLRKRAKKAQRQASQARKQARQANRQLALCREEAEL